jgi:signal transduction histidine kinase
MHEGVAMPVNLTGGANFAPHFTLMTPAQRRVGQTSVDQSLMEQIWQILNHSGSFSQVLCNLIAWLGRRFAAQSGLIALVESGLRGNTPVLVWNQDEAEVATPWDGDLACFTALIEAIAPSPTSPLSPFLMSSGLETNPAVTLLQQWIASCPFPPSVGGFSDLNQSTLLMMPIVYGSIQGIIVLTQPQPSSWRVGDVTMLHQLSQSVAIALSQVQLQQRVQQQMRYQTLIDRLTEAIRRASDLQEIFQVATAGITECLNVSRSLVLLLRYSDPYLGRTHPTADAQAKAMVKAQWPLACFPMEKMQHPDCLNPEGDQEGTWINYAFRVSDCHLCEQILQSPDCPVILPSTVQAIAPLSGASEASSAASLATLETTSDPLIRAIAPVFQLTTMPSLLLFPLENQGNVLGYLAVQQESQFAWSEDEVMFVKLVAAQVSTAIIQAHTIQHIQSLVEERTAQLQRSLDVQAKLYAKTRQQIDQLQMLNRLKDEFVSTMSHELRTPLTSMALAIRMLRQESLSDERRAKYLNILEQQCAQETNLINDLLTLQKLATGQSTPHVQTLDVRYLLRDLAKSFESTMAETGIMLRITAPEQPIKIQTDVESLSRVLSELVTNACKYSHLGHDIRLEVSNDLPTCRETGKRAIAITVTNWGDGIAEDELPFIFEKFRRGRGVTQRAIPGTGLGLSLVKGLVEYLNGKVTATSIPTKVGDQEIWETSFQVKLPQVFSGTSI